MPDNIVGSAWVRILPDLSGFEGDLFAKLDVSMKKVQAFADARPITLRVNLDTSAAMAQIAALRAAGAGIGGGGGAGFGAGAAAGASGGNGGGGFLTGAALTKLIGFGPGGGTGANIPFTPIAMAGAFSLASFAGLGLEHVLFTLVGLAGSLAGAFAGLGVLAVGALGKIGVGMGSDAVVMSSTIADTKTLYNALTAIQTAQLTYGKNSTQAAAATQQLNIQMALIGNTAGVKAELGLAKAGQALNTFWDKATSSARVAAVGFITPFISIADTYIPLINTAATKNFSLMTVAFKPFIDWANGPVATGIFNNLEKMFAADIPIGVNALTQFVELLAKIANWAAPQTGGLLDTISKWLTKENTPAGFTNVTHTMTILIGMFHDWVAFFKIAFEDIVDIFKLTAGLGTGIIQTLTTMLDKLHAWLQETNTKDTLHNLFELHKQEVIDILKLLPSLLKGLGTVYLTVAPALTKAFTAILGAIAPILDAITSTGAGSWILGLTLILAKLGLLTGALATLKGAFAWLNGFGAGGSSGVSSVAGDTFGQRVFVTNWPPGFGAGTGTGVSPVVTGVGSGLAGAGEGAGAALTGSAVGEGAGLGVGTSVGLGVAGFLLVNGITEALLKTQVNAFNTAANSKTVSDAYNAFAGILKGGKFFTYASGQQEALHVLSQALHNAGLHGGHVETAISDVEKFMKNGAISASNSAVDMQTFVSLWNAGVRNTKKMQGVLDTVNSYVAKYGPLTSGQVKALEENIAAGDDSAFDIQKSLSTAAQTVGQLPNSFQGLKNSIDYLAQNLPGVLGLTGEGRGFFFPGDNLPTKPPKGKFPTTINMTNHFHGTNPSETNKAIESNNAALVRALEGAVMAQTVGRSSYAAVAPAIRRNPRMTSKPIMAREDSRLLTRLCCSGRA